MGIDYLEIARRALADRKPLALGEESEVQAGVDHEARLSIPISDTRVNETIRHAAVGILNREAARLFFLDGVLTVGIWASADRPETRTAIRALYPGNVGVIHLEDAPARYRQYKPSHQKAAQQLVPPDTTGMSWAEWEKARLDRLFREAEIARNAPDTKYEINERNERRREANDTTEHYDLQSCTAAQSSLFSSRRTEL